MMYDSWSLEADLRKAGIAHATELGGYATRVAQALEKYAGRRTIEADMVREVIDLAMGYAAEAECRHKAEAITTTARATYTIERLEGEVERKRETITSLRRSLDEKRAIHEARKAAGDDQVEVTFTNGFTGWTVASLEEIAYRLRLGGAVDDTRVDITGARATGLVADPTLIQLDMTPPQSKPAPRPDPGTVAPAGLPHTPWLLGRLAAAGALIVAVVAGLVKLLGVFL